MYMPSILPHDPNLILVACDMSGAYRTTDGGKTWDMIHHEYLLGSTRCRSVFDPRDPNVVFGAHGYRGELRATGQVLRDQFVFMLRAGFDAFEVMKEGDAEAFAATVKRYSVFYQPTGDGRITALHRRMQLRHSESAGQ